MPANSGSFLTPPTEAPNHRLRPLFPTSPFLPPSGPADGSFNGHHPQRKLLGATLSILMRATTEEINGLWQGACYPFREGLAAGIMNVEFPPQGQLIAGGFTTNAQWPVRSTEPFAIQHIDWNGAKPFEIKEINIKKGSFLITFTKPVDASIAAKAESCDITTDAHIYHAGYGRPEVDQTTARVTKEEPSADGLSVLVHLEKIEVGHIHDFNLAPMISKDGTPLLHTKASYTVNEFPHN